MANLGTTSSITQYGITWAFSAPVQYGTFVNGDYYVVDTGVGVTISSKTPAPETVGGNARNGSFLNPTCQPFTPYDDRVRADTYDPARNLIFPASLASGDSLISTVSRNLAGEVPGDITLAWDGTTPDSKCMVESAAVLTVLSAHPSNTTFRPSYVDRSHTLYDFADVDVSGLPQLSTAGVSSPDLGIFSTPLEKIKRCIERPWILHTRLWVSRDSHPALNMHAYHRNTSEMLSEMYLYAISDMPKDQDFWIRIVQLGLDFYTVGITGPGEDDYFKLPVLFAGLVLNNTDMLNVFVIDDVTMKCIPRDDPDFYYWEDNLSSEVSAIVQAGQTWSGHSVFFQNSLNLNEQHEHLHPSEWRGAPASIHWKNEHYRMNTDSHPWVGQVLASRILGLQDKWDKPEVFAYVDRWMTDNRAEEAAVKGAALYTEQVDIDAYIASYSQVRGGSAFVDTMWTKHRGHTPEVQTPTASSNVIMRPISTSGVHMGANLSTPYVPALLTLVLDTGVLGSLTKYAGPYNVNVYSADGEVFLFNATGTADGITYPVITHALLARATAYAITNFGTPADKIRGWVGVTSGG